MIHSSYALLTVAIPPRLSEKHKGAAAFDGENLATVSKLMGHSNVETTMHYLRDINKGTDDVNTMSRLGLENTLHRHAGYRAG